jgi:hypothetical protein
MALQLSVAVRTARLDQIETTVGTAPSLIIYSGAQPANCAEADPAGVLCTIVLPSNWLADAAAGVKALAGSWQDNASAAGDAASWRIKQGATCHLQGNVTATGGGGDLELNNTSISIGQQVTVTGFTLTDGNA